MDEKRKIVEIVKVRAVLKALTPEAIEAMPQPQRVNDMVIIRKFPFRIGRESRVRMVDGRIVRVERPKLGGREPNNDLYLLDGGELLNISREHLQLEKHPDGYKLIDRGSACGVRIGERAVGGCDDGGEMELVDGDVFVMGTTQSPYRYQFIVLDE
ncbi:FHA domain-containing protein [Desulfosediminicola ganghwensis]|uniref:FHA domain-containing protein n=1 Tax=Desulfosediminicola ganghwensis TaxID=2569540 RepID=UPI0010AC4403|nr:FHA domain-containing protein [Desulfosediminicola ganghwensis]